MLEMVDDNVLDKEKVSWSEVVNYICTYRDIEVIVTWDTMKEWLETHGDMQIWD